ncbi:hypothetical protein [Nodosilinea sp. E11]|uniref:hypothetical protein n=1 Tax=Nodosilinea sp. E11 TaxID=3037479 RepID=UPI0029342B84|nr:hypothetical protein [Nodosilinea sp. E11]WOD38243.1 hypothetical protein RRF56_18695 [Nodosilinea sp. E11]
MSTRNIDPNNRDLESSVNTRPATQNEIAYRDGYVRGKSAEQLERDRRRAAEARVYEENARLRADNGVSTGVVLGFILAAIAAIFGGVLYLYNNEAGTGQGTTNPTPATTTPATTAPEPPTNETTIIERTIERTQEVVPAPSSAEPPQINVELNNPFQPGTAPNPQADPNQPPAETPQAE